MAKVLQKPSPFLSQVMRDSTRESGSDVEKDESDESTTASSQPWSVDPSVVELSEGNYMDV